MAETELSFLGQLTQAAANRSPAGILIADENTATIVYANSAVASLLHMPQTTLDGLPLAALSSQIKMRDAQGQAISFDQIRGLRNGRSDGWVEMVIHRTDRKERVVLAHAARLQDTNDQGKALVYTLVDISNHKRKERENHALELRLQHSSRLAAIEQLTSGVGHQLNNFLGAILGNTNLAQLSLKEQRPVQEHLQSIEEAARRATSLIQQMTAQSHKDYPEQLGSRLDRVLTEMQPLIRAIVSKKAELIIDTSGTVGEIAAETAELRQIVINLATNASDALGETPGTITIRCTTEHFDAATLNNEFPDGDHRPGRYTVFEVADTGMGMEPEEIERALEPFYSTKFAGRGLGLPTVLGIVKAHSGEMVVQSEPGEGTTVRILLRALTGSRPADAPTEQDQPSIAFEGRVLLAEDETAVRHVARLMLQQLGFEVVVAVDGQEAVEQFDRFKGDFRFALIDLTMPRLGGAECVEELQKRNPSLRILFTSGYNASDVQLVQQRSEIPFVAKPYQMDTLKTAIIKTLA